MGFSGQKSGWEALFEFKSFKVMPHHTLDLITLDFCPLAEEAHGSEKQSQREGALGLVIPAVWA